MVSDEITIRRGKLSLSFHARIIDKLLAYDPFFNALVVTGITALFILAFWSGFIDYPLILDVRGFYYWNFNAANSLVVAFFIIFMHAVYSHIKPALRRS